MPAAQQADAQAKLLAHELAGVERATLMPGAAVVLDTCRALGMKSALLTRNTRLAVDIAMERFEDLRFDLIRCREDGIVKPEPDGVLVACETLGVAPRRAVSLGDFHFDILAANAAGLLSVLLTTSDNWRDFAHEADHVIDSLEDFLTIIT
jgi:phosphoglycolate phosphatase